MACFIWRIDGLKTEAHIVSGCGFQNPLSTYACNFKLRRYAEEYVPDAMDPDGDGGGGEEEGGDYADYIVSDGVGSVGEAETDMLLAQVGDTSGPYTPLAMSFLS
jgi:hypothetical protein